MNDYPSLALPALLARAVDALLRATQEDCDCGETRARDEDPGYTCSACGAAEVASGIEAWQAANPQVVETPGGNLTVTLDHADEFPGVTVYAGERQVAVIEWNSCAAALMGYLWAQDEEAEDPLAVLNITKGVVE